VKLTHLFVDGFRGLPDRRFSFVDRKSNAPLDRVVITGPSASGKTSALAAILAAKEDIAPYGFAPSPARLVRHDARAAKVTVGWWLDDEERGLAGTTSYHVESESIFRREPSKELPTHDAGLASVLDRYTHDAERPTGKLDYFADNRSLDAGIVSASEPRVFDQRRLRLGNDARKYAAIPRYLLDLCAGYGDAYDANGAVVASGIDRFRALFAQLCRTKSFVGRRSIGGRPALIFGDAHREVELHELSKGEQQAVLFAATAQMIGLHRSVILVDSPELYLGSSDVVPFVEALERLGHDNQFVFATGSRELVAATPAHAVIHLERSGS
jgi:hypothetical protein